MVVARSHRAIMGRKFAALTVAAALARSAALDIEWTDSRGRAFDPLRDWMGSLVVPLPEDLVLPIPIVGYLTLLGGMCTNFTVADIVSADLSDGMVLDFGVEVQGIGVRCVIDGYSHKENEEDSGPVQINVTLGNSSLGAEISLAPYSSPWFDSPQLPLGGFNMTNCNLDLGVSSLEFAGSGEMYDMLDGLKDVLPMMIGSMAGGLVCDELTKTAESSVNDFMDSWRDAVAAFTLPPPPRESPEPLTETLDWGKYPLVQVVQALLTERFPLFTNRVIQLLSLVELNATVFSQNNVSMSVMDFGVEGTGGDKPGLAVIAEGTSLGFNASLDGMAFSTSLKFDVDLPGQTPFSHNLDIKMGLHEIAVAVRAMVSTDSMHQVEAAGAMSSPACLAQCINGTSKSFDDSVDVQMLEVLLLPLLQFSSEGWLESEAAHLINTVVRAVMDRYLDSINALINGVLGMLRESVASSLADSLKSSTPCVHENEGSLLSDEAILGLYWAAVSIALIGLPISAIVHLVSLISGRRARGNDGAEADGSSVVIPEASAVPDEKDLRALCFEGFIPLSAAVYFPFAVIAVMFLFANADLDIMARVDIILTADGERAPLKPLFAMSLVSTIIECWKSGAYFIAVLTIIASGVWPFIKLSLLIFAWFTPPRYLNLSRRGKCLFFLDTWGKYSFLDSWFLVILLSAFEIDWHSVGSAELKIQTTPAPAFYAFFAATVLSLVLGHIASECHQHALNKRNRAIRLADEAKESSQTRAARELAHSSGSALWKFSGSKVRSLALAGMIFAALVLSALGAFLTSFSFEVTGLIPEFLFGRRMENFFSIFSAGVASAEGRYGEAGLVSLEVVFLTLAVVVPLVLLASLLMLWVLPLTLSVQKTLLHVCYMLDAWSSMDVAVLVLVICCFEFERLADYLVYGGDFKEACTLVKNVTHEECMDIILHGQPPLFLLFCVGVVLLVLPKVALPYFGRCIEQRCQGPCVAKSVEDKMHNVCEEASNADAKPQKEEAEKSDDNVVAKQDINVEVNEQVTTSS